MLEIRQELSKTSLQRDFQRNHTGMSHRPDGQEVTLMPFAALFAKLEDFTAELDVYKRQS